jgi:hypothetical protein
MFLEVFAKAFEEFHKNLSEDRVLREIQQSDHGNEHN